MAFDYTGDMSRPNMQQMNGGHISGAIVIAALALLLLMYKGFSSISVTAN